MGELWQKSLLGLQDQFREGAKKYPGLRRTVMSSLPGDRLSFEQMFDHWNYDGGYLLRRGVDWPIMDAPKVCWDIWFNPDVMSVVLTGPSTSPSKIPEWAAEDFRLAREGVKEFVRTATAASHTVCTGLLETGADRERRFKHAINNYRQSR